MLVDRGAPALHLVADGDEKLCIGHVRGGGVDGIHPRILLRVDKRVDADLRVTENEEVPVAVTVIGGVLVLRAPPGLLRADLIAVGFAGLQARDGGRAGLGEKLSSGRD